ncbi:MAG: TIGR01777 family oxidoreductase [Bacteroidota bacterium]
MKKRIVIAGGTGFLGRALQSYFTEQGFEVFILTRNPLGPNEVYWDGESFGEWCYLLEGAYALINLAGKSVNCRYTEKNKALIRSSRLNSTHVLGKALQVFHPAPKYWINSSTATIYEHTEGDAPHNTEHLGRIADDFSVLVAKDWEAAFDSYQLPETKKLTLRTAIVFGNEGGAYPVMRDLGRKGLCSPQGSGKQWISWIHIEDFCRAVDFLMEEEKEGTFNLCAPNYLRNEDFFRLLKKKLKPPFSIPQPEWLLKLGALFMGTEAELILKSRKVYPEKLLMADFRFKYEDMESCLEELLSDKIQEKEKKISELPNL